MKPKYFLPSTFPKSTLFVSASETSTRLSGTLITLSLFTWNFFIVYSPFCHKLLYKVAQKDFACVFFENQTHYHYDNHKDKLFQTLDHEYVNSGHKALIIVTSLLPVPSAFSPTHSCGLLLPIMPLRKPGLGSLSEFFVNAKNLSPLIEGVEAIANSYLRK